MAQRYGNGSRAVALGRRSFIGAAGAAASLPALGTRRARAYHENYDDVIDVVEAGADNGGSEPIGPVLRDVAADDTLLKFPKGQYRITEEFRFTDFTNFGMVGDRAVIAPDPADEYDGESVAFKLGTYYSPGRKLRFEGFSFDFTSENTGLRAVQAQVSDGLTIRDLYFGGQHDAGTWGPMLADIVDSGGSGVVENVEMLYGGAYTENTDQDADPTVDVGPTGFIVSPYHQGHLTCNNLRIGPFPDNGFYASCDNGRVTLNGGYFRGSNVTSVRLAGDGSSIQGATVEVDHNRPEDVTQRGIRLDNGAGVLVSDVEVNLEDPNGNAITVLGSVESARIEDTAVTVGDRVNDGIVVQEDTGPVEIVDTTVEMTGGGQALMVKSGDGDVLVRNVSVSGDASGARGGRCAIRCERQDTRFEDLIVDQPGDGYRRALGVHADNCVVSGGTYRATHHPIVDSGSAVEFVDVTARSYDGYEGVKLLDSSSDVAIRDSIVYEGIRDQGCEGLETSNNDYPDS